MEPEVTEDRVATFAAGEIAKLHDALSQLASPRYSSVLTRIVGVMVTCLRSGGTVMFCGNGGSAADSQHLAAELVGRQNYDRPPASGVALTVDTSALTAIGNDYGYDQVFARQVAALGRAGDVLVGLSTSGRSPSVVRALAAAGERGMTTVAFTGEAPADLGSADVVLAVPASETAKVQELHITAGHIVLALVEQTLHPAPLPR